MSAGKSRLSIALIGYGNWGSSLVHGLLSAGVTPREIVVRAGAGKASGLPLVSWKQARLDAQILWLCVPDTNVVAVAERIAGMRKLRGQVVVHSSGALTAEALAPARQAGARVAAVHPVMTFPTRDPVPLPGVLFGIETTSRAARQMLSGAVRQLGGVPFTVDSSRKALYHAAGTMASPLLVSAVAAAMETARAAGLGEHAAKAVVEALARTTLRNLFDRGVRSSFSGPFARGDAATVNLHLQALAPHPILADVYRSLAIHAAETLPVRRRRALLRALSREESVPRSGTGKGMRQNSA